MSGYFGNTEAEQKIKINEYLKTLDEQIENDDINLQANKNYLLNGVLPQSTQMVDTRTTSEKLADFEKLKKDIADEFTGVFEPNVSFQIVEKLISSALNYDNKLLVFLAQNAPEFVKTLKKKYKYGVKGDANDIETIVQIISDLYNDIKGSLQSVKDYTTKGYKNIGLSKGDMSKLFEELFVIKNSLLKSRTKNERWDVNRLFNNLILDLEKISQNIFRDDVLNYIYSIATSHIQNLSDPQLTTDINIYHNFLSELPPFSSIKSLVNNIDMSIKSQNFDKITEIINRIYQLINKPLAIIDNNPATFDKVHQYANKVELPRDNQRPNPIPMGNGISGSGLTRRGRPRKEKQKSEKIEKYIGFGINEVNAKKLNEKSVMTIRRKNKSNFMNIPSRVVGEKLKSAIQSIIGGKMPDYKTLNGLTDDEKNYLHKIMSVSGLTEKFAVPTPSKDSIEKDIHEFEVMKGEILSGNDSKELIRKFKLLIVKLARSSVLPRNDVNELLLLLADLNY